MKRIRMPKGHVELSLGGTNFKSDETGAFTVPDEHADDLIRVHGGKEEMSLDQMKARVDAAKTAAANAKLSYERAVIAARDEEATFEKYKEQMKVAAARVAADNKAAEDKAAEEARIVAAAAAEAAAGAGKAATAGARK
jgi:hypothetical protein